MENKFAPIQIRLPLIKDLEKALPEVKRTMNGIKSSYGLTYTTYVLSILVGLLVPKFIAVRMQDQLTKPFTCAFSNTPGCLRPIKYKDQESIGQVSAIVSSGRVGIALCLISYVDGVRFSVTADTSIMTKPKELCDLFEESLNDYIKLSQ